MTGSPCNDNLPPVCDYENSDYQARFWDTGDRAYEDGAEAVALRRLLPQRGNLLLELGAGAGRNTPRYAAFARVVLLDYSLTQLQQAKQRLADESGKYCFVAANAYRLPFMDGVFDTATMIRTLHHLADAPLALGEAQRVLQAQGVFILEFANKRNLKAILRYALRRQTWSPFTRDPLEFVKLNFDFHPAAVQDWLEACGFTVQRRLAVSYLRVGLLKRAIPLPLLVGLDTLLQGTGEVCPFSPSVFVRAQKGSAGAPAALSASPAEMLRCPACATPIPGATLFPGEQNARLECTGCRRTWEVRDGIYDFRMA